MTGDIRPEYDVVIMGGGPAGATLGALLAKRTDLRVAIFERSVFPREHIGESFAHPLIPVLEESGALPKVLASDCWVRKHGGIFHWDDGDPKVTFFDHANWVVDGVHRWALHVNRAEFDAILLDHAADLGVEVFQGVAVTGFASDAAGAAVTLRDGRTVGARYVVDASGRRNSLAAGRKRSWLSAYRNIAIWQHFVGGRPAQGLAGDWNVFRGPDLSPIGCFAFPDGWCWYIPVPKVVDGERRMTHSIGIVTDPAVLRRPGTDFTDQRTFLETVRRVPLLRELVQDVRPVADTMLTATNYSMINDRFADLDERWILVGDASYFVDPLFSSGVAFAATQAAAAALLLETTLRPGADRRLVADLWRDYDSGWHGMAETFALSIDQWYHAIGRNHPGGAYWRDRTVDLDLADRTFDALLNTAFTPDLLQLITQGSRRVADLDATGPFVRAAGRAEPAAVDPDAPLLPAPGLTVRRGGGLDVPGFKGFVPPPPYTVPPAVSAAITRYWRDPVAHGPGTPSPLDAPVDCHRFTLPDGTEVRGLDRDGAAEVWALVTAGGTVRELAGRLTPVQFQLVRRLLRAGLLVAADRVATPG